jgi:hypothetical protein
MRGKFVILLEGYKLRVPGNKVPRRYLDINRYAIYRGKVKVKSLCLTKYLAMKKHSVLNYESRHEDVWGTGGISPRILSFGTRWE